MLIKNSVNLDLCGVCVREYCHSHTVCVKLTHTSMFPGRESNSIFRFSEPNRAFRVFENKIVHIQSITFFFVIRLSKKLNIHIYTFFTVFTKFNVCYILFVFSICIPCMQCYSEFGKNNTIWNFYEARLICLLLHVWRAKFTVYLLPYISPTRNSRFVYSRLIILFLLSLFWLKSW